MALNLSQKEHIIGNIAEEAKESISVVTAEYIGMTVAELTDLRAVAKKSNVEVKVVKNTLARLAFADTEHECLNEVLKGPLLLAFAKDGPGDAAKVLDGYTKVCPKLKVVGLSLDGKLLGSSDQLKAVARLPSRDEALASLMGTMQAPIVKLAQTMQAVPSKLVRTVDAIRSAKAA